MSENTFNITATIKIKPEFVAEARKEMSNLVNLTLKEKGCISYKLMQAAKDETSFIIIEEWETREDLGNHSESAHFKAWNEKAGNMVSEPAKITFWNKVA